MADEAVSLPGAGFVEVTVAVAGPDIALTKLYVKMAELSCALDAVLSPSVRAV